MAVTKITIVKVYAEGLGEGEKVRKCDIYTVVSFLEKCFASQGVKMGYW
jgi:hypothetical protein